MDKFITEDEMREQADNIIKEILKTNPKTASYRIYYAIRAIAYKIKELERETQVNRNPWPKDGHDA